MNLDWGSGRIYSKSLNSFGTFCQLMSKKQSTTDVSIPDIYMPASVPDGNSLRRYLSRVFGRAN